MENQRELIEILRRIEANQVKSLEAQAQHLSLAQAKFQKTETTVDESVKLQRIAFQQQQRVRSILIPVLLFMVGFLIYVGYKGNLF